MSEVITDPLGLQAAPQVSNTRCFNRNANWCRCIIEELCRCGIRHVVMSPGGRSAALVMMLRAEPRLRCEVQIEERSAAFLALGIARAVGRPVAVCTTSGSAVANLTPALVEAHASGIPLVLLTCDRPRKQRGTGVGQITDQISLCAPFVCAQLDLEDPVDDPQTLVSLHLRVRALLERAAAPESPGPVHLNIPQEGRNSAIEIDPRWKAPEPVMAGLSAQESESASVMRQKDAKAIADDLGIRPNMRGLIIAGPDCPWSASQCTRLVATTGFPVVADAPSNLRRPAIANLVTEADALVVHPKFWELRPELIIRLGPAPVTPTTHHYLGAQRCAVLRIDSRKIQADFLHDGFVWLHSSNEPVVLALADLASYGDREWLDLWLDGSRNFQRKRESFCASLKWGECLAASIICNAQGFPLFHLANSMAIRHGNLHCSPRSWGQQIFANRGVNGIDGTISTFLGEVLGSGLRGLLMIGDQAMLHDLPALAAAQNPTLNACICIINNGGGALFDLLNCELPGFSEALRNPPHVDFTQVAAAFGLKFIQVGSEAELRQALSAAECASGVTIIDVQVPPDSLQRDFKPMFEAMLS